MSSIDKIIQLTELVSLRVSVVAAISVLMLIESALSLSVPWLAGQYTTGLLAGDTFAGFSLTALLLMWLSIILVLAFLRYINRFLVTRHGAQLLNQLSIRLYEHLQSLPLSFFQERKRGDLLSLLSNDIAILSYFVTGTLSSLVPMLATLVGSFVLMAWIEWRFALLVAALVPVYFLVLKLLGRRMKTVSTAVADQQGEAMAVAAENLGMVSLIKLFSQEAHQSGRFAHQANEVLNLRTDQLKLQAKLGPAIQLLAGVGILLVLWLSHSLFLEGAITAPELVTLLLYGLLFARPVSQGADLYGQVQQVLGVNERLSAVFAVSPEPVDEGDKVLTGTEPSIELKNVSFGYYADKPLLSDLDLKIDSGQTIAITGVNGSGKTTLHMLLLRFLEPWSGDIFVDGLNIRDVKRSSLRSQIGVVTQHVLLSDSTIAENIAFGHPESSREDIIAAARAAHAHAFIEQLPGGYETRIGDAGSKLSGGQKQRIAMARVLLNDPPVLVLDEATAMFDPDSEKAFLDEIRAHFHTRTVIIITHRTASLALADKVYQLREGQLHAV